MRQQTDTVPLILQRTLLLLQDHKNEKADEGAETNQTDTD